MFARKGHSLATKARLAGKKGRRLKYFVAVDVAKMRNHYEELEKQQPFNIKQVLAKQKDKVQGY